MLKNMYTLSCRLRRGSGGDRDRHCPYNILFCAVLSLTLIISGLPHSIEAKPTSNSNKSPSLSAQEFREFAEPDSEVDVAKLGPQQVLELLLSKFKSKTQHQNHHQPRMIFEEITEKDVADLCAKSASVKCGKQVLERLDDSIKLWDIDEKCSARRDFMECIDLMRRDCKALANNGIYPMLPVQSEIRAIREQVAKKLWASGACVLGPG